MRQIVRWVAVGTLALAGQAGAVIVGSPTGSPADSPANHVDPNLTSSPYGGVVGINVAGIGPATGVLLKSGDAAHSYVLTAAHIVDPNRNGSVAPVGNISVHVNYNGNSSTVLGVSSFHVNPAWYTNTGVFNDDLLILKLDGVVPAGVPTYNIHRTLTTLASPVQTITIVGYGESGDGVSGPTISNGVNVKRVGQNRADAVGSDDEGSGAFEVYQFDFDKPDGSNGVFGGPTLGNATEVQFGIGDSGGPAFITGAGGELFVYGITSAGFNTGNGNFPLFGSVGGGQLVSAYQPFIDAIVPEPGTFGLLAVATAGLLAKRPRTRDC